VRRYVLPVLSGSSASDLAASSKSYVRGERMLSPEEYMSLESAIASLRRESPVVLKAIAKMVNSFDPRAEFSRNTIDASAYGKTVQGFAITYGQLGAYLDIAVTKYASVLIETEVGVLESQHVKINREWLLAQREQVAGLPEVAKAIALRSCASNGATVTPILPQLEDQTPDSSRTELRKLNIRIERNLIIPADDDRGHEIERLQRLLDTTKAEKTAAIEDGAALTRMVKTLSLENDQLRKARVEKNNYADVHLPSAPQAITRPLSNVELLNVAKQKTRDAICSYARELWAHSDFAGCRTGKMAQIVRRAVDPELAKYLPATDTVLARWLTSDAAPPSAKRKGRPSKSDPNK
jgi:hypothetical protein